MRRALFMVLVLVAVAISAAFWRSQLSVTPPPAIPGVNVVDAGGTGLRYPGDLKQVGTGQDSAWVAVYERKEGERGSTYAREAADPLGPFGPPIALSDPARAPAYDPGVVELPGGQVIVTWSSRAGVSYVEREGPGSYGPIHELFRDPGGRVQEQTVYRFLGLSFIAYNYKPYSRTTELWDVRIRVLGAGPKVGPPSVVTTEGPGPGPEGKQKRVTVAPTGRGRELIAVWNQHDAGLGPRSVFGSISPDAGQTWGPAFGIVSSPGHDLVNPFAISMSADDLRVYFTQQQHHALGEVRSSDQGRTWGSIATILDRPEGTTSGRIVLADDLRHGLIAFAATVGFTQLVTYPVAD